MKQLRTQIDETTSDYDREKLQERLAKLVGGVAVIKVGAATETEMKEKKARVEDAMHATRAAVEEGIVPGGGVALVRALPALEKLKLEGDEQIGVNIVKRALEEPLRMIASNAGHEGAVVIGKVRESKDPNYRLQRRDRRIHRHDFGRYSRSGQGDAHRAAERRVDRGSDADDRSSGFRNSGRRQGSGWSAWRRRAANVLDLRPKKPRGTKKAAPFLMCGLICASGFVSPLPDDCYMTRVEELRRKYPVFRYERFQIDRTPSRVSARFHFSIPPDISFTPEIQFEPVERRLARRP